MSSSAFQRQSDTKDRAFAFFAAGADLAAVTMDDLFTQRKPEACALISIFCVQPGKGVEDLFRLVLVEPDSIIQHDDLGMQAADSGGNRDGASHIRLRKFQGIIDEVIEQLV